MKLIFCFMCICFIVYLMLFARDAISAAESNCKPHIYLSGKVEIRGAKSLYVIEYNNLAELAYLLKSVHDDTTGHIEWMGTD